MRLKYAAICVKMLSQQCIYVQFQCFFIYNGMYFCPISTFLYLHMLERHEYLAILNYTNPVISEPFLRVNIRTNKPTFR